MPLISRGLQAFLVVAEELHFGRAARRLHLSQPPLSQLIRQFEQELDAVLFVRTTRTVQLTPAGRLLYDRGRQLVADAEAAGRGARRVARGEMGRMTLGFTHSTVYEVLPRALQTFRERYPDVELELRQLTSGLLVDGVRTGKVDLALVRYSASMRDPDFASALVASDPLLLVLPQEHPLAELPTVPVGALHGVPFIGYSAEDSRYFHDRVEALFVRHGVRPQVVHASFLPTLLALVEARMGVGLVPAAAVPRRETTLVARPLATVEPGLDRADLHCVWRRDNASGVVPAFVDVLLRSGRPSVA